MTTRARNIIPRQTTQRVERTRILINALLAGDMTRDEIGEVLQVGPSGVRKYLTDLGNMLGIVRHIDSTPTFVGFPVYRLAVTATEAQAYLDRLAANASARAVVESRSALSVATRDPSRHFHILEDDTHYAIRPSRFPVGRDPLVAAFFGADRHEVRA